MSDTHEYATPPASKRCAVYTRVSVDDGNDGEIGSTDVQFMACHELIASQRGQGWQACDRLYEDKGVSGSHLERPGLQKLLADVCDRRVDVVVVHRLDRLTRHLGDLQKLMELFEQHGVALVSVTQSLDTTDLHGRLALNLLTSFAQFERELIGERSREKRAATRRQGVWYGNAPPLGYTLVRPRLVVDSKEAEVVRSIFTGFVEQDAVTALIKDLADRGIKTKRWKTQAGQARGGRPFDRNALYKVLNNRVYIGEVFYDDAWHTGDHEAIVPAELWAKVHALMKSRSRRTGVSNTPTPDSSFMLKGLIVDAGGRAMSPCLSSAYKNQHYTYYVSQSDIAVGAGTSGVPRIATRKIHAAVWSYIREGLRDPQPWFDALPPALTSHPSFDRQIMAGRLRQVEAAIDKLFPANQTALLRQLVEQVVVDKKHITVRLSAKGIFELLLELLDESYLRQVKKRRADTTNENGA